MGGARAKIPDNSALQSEIVFIPNQLAADTNQFIAAEDISATVDGQAYAVTAANQFNPNVGGRNVTITLTEAAGAALDAVFDIEGYDQFNNFQVERTGTVTAAAPHTGAKIFQRVTRVVVVDINDNAAGDTMDVGYGDKVGIPRMFSANLEEIIGASLVIAAGTTVTAKTVNTTNFDTTYFALKAAFFAASAVVGGDSIAIMFRGSGRTPDDTARFPARS